MSKFEADLDVKGARAKANMMAEEFTRMTGINLTFSTFYIDSPTEGYTDDLKDFPADDPDALFVFSFDETDNDYETVNFIPTLNKVVVWRSVSDDNPCEDEGAVNPKTGVAEWEEWLVDGAYELSEWKMYSRPKW